MSFATWLQMLKWNYNLVESSGHIRFCEHLSVDCFRYGTKLYVASLSPSSCPQYSTLNDMSFANNQSAHLRQLQKQLFFICSKIFPYTSYMTYCLHSGACKFQLEITKIPSHVFITKIIEESPLVLRHWWWIWKEWKLCTIPMKEFNVVRMQL